MPEIRVKHNIATATEPPRREAVPSGTYEAMIANVVDGATRTTPPRAKITMEFQIVKDDAGDNKYNGRRVYQDFVIEPGGEYDDREKWRLKQALEAVKCPYRIEDGCTMFNTDHLVGKSVKITIKTAPGKPDPKELEKPVEQRKPPQEFSRVERVDTVMVNEDDLI